MKRVGLFVLVLSVLSFPLFAGGGRQAAAGGDQILQLAQVQGWPGGYNSAGDLLMNPWGYPAYLTPSLMFDPLITLDFDGNPFAYKLAEKMEISPDGLIYTFTFRDNIKWHDGQPLTTEDFKWSVKTIEKVPASFIIAGTVRQKFLLIEGMEEWLDGKAADVTGIITTAKTITFKLTTPDFSFLVAIAGFAPLPKHILEQQNPTTILACDFWSGKAVGSGPYRVKEFVPNGYTTLTAFDGYYGEKPKIKDVNVVYFADSQAAAAYAMTGKIDYLYTTSWMVAKQIQSSGYYDIATMDINYERQLTVNYAGPANSGPNRKLQDKRVIDALVYAIDAQKICDTLFDGGATPHYAKTAPSSQYYDKRYNQYNYDPVKAKQLLAEAKFDMSQKLIITTSYTGDQQSANIVEAIAGYWRDIGLTVETSVMPNGADEMAYIYDQRNYDFNYSGSSSGTDLQIYEAYARNESYRKLWGGFVNYAAFEPYVQRFLAASNVQERIAIASEFQRIEQEEKPFLPLFLVPHYVLTNKRLSTPGYKVEHNYPTDFGFEKWAFK
jgi:peptide/nickel transport system substrate-binding protein